MFLTKCDYKSFIRNGKNMLEIYNMREFLESVINLDYSVDFINRKYLSTFKKELLYFYHYSIKISDNKNHYSNELIQCTKEFYLDICQNENDKAHHKPVSYLSNDIPNDKIVRSVIIKDKSVDDDKFCQWKQIDEGSMGISDYVYQTSCGEKLDVDRNKKLNFCQYCGKKIK